MRFSDLLDLPFDAGTGAIDIRSILDAAPNVPESVAQQFLADHGRKSEFQEHYAHLDLGQLVWSLESHSAADLARVAVYRSFRPWFDQVRARAGDFSSHGWSCVDRRECVQIHWSTSGTWIVPPVLLPAALVAGGLGLHAVEGHTRLGLLAGLVEHGVLRPTAEHRAWVGHPVA